MAIVRKTGEFVIEQGNQLYLINPQMKSVTLRKFYQHKEQQVNLAISESGNIVLSDVREWFTIWDVSKPKTRKIMEQSFDPFVPTWIDEVAISRSERLFAVGQTNRVLIYNKERLVRQVIGHDDELFGVAFLGPNNWPMLSADRSG